MKLRVFNPMDIELETKKEVMTMKAMTDVPSELFDAFLKTQGVNEKLRRSMIQIKEDWSNQFSRAFERLARRENDEKGTNDKNK